MPFAIRFFVWVIILTCMGDGLCSLVIAGASQDHSLSFDVATVKVVKRFDPTARTIAGCHGVDKALTEGLPVARGRCRYEGYTLKLLIATAYGVPSDRVVSCPSWCETDRYDVEGIAENVGSVTQGELLLMMRQLLAEKFQLQLKAETRVVAGYDLIVAKDGLKLKQLSGNEARKYTRYFPGIINLQGSITTLSSMLSAVMHAPVRDSTGLSGTFDITINWTPDATSAEMRSGQPTPESTIFDSLQEQLGLKLQPKKISIDVMVVQAAAKAQTN